MFRNTNGLLTLNNFQKFDPSKEKNPPDTIKEEVEKICTSSEFNSKERSCQLLHYLIDETINGRGDQLKQYTIGRSVFKRDENFNPDLDPIVRIQAGRLRRSLDIYYLTEGKNDPVRISILKGSYKPVFLRHKDPDPKITTGAPVPDQEEISPLTGPSISVLPFKNLTGSSEREFFVQGFSEELTQELTHYEDFRVIYVRLNADNMEKYSKSENTGSVIEADYIIEGAVREEGERIKISATLIHTKSREQIWGEQYLRQMTAGDLIAIQEEISQQVIAAIAGEYGIIPQRLSRETRQKRTSELSVYEAMLRYYYYQSQQTPETAGDAYDALQNALTKDPDCATVLAMLASLNGNIYMLDTQVPEDALNRMIELSRRAVDLEPDNQLVCLVHAWTYFVLNDRDRFFGEIEKTLALNPNSPLRLGACGFFISLYGEWEKGKDLLDRAMKQNIGYPPWYYGATTLYYYRLNKFEKAFREAVKYDAPALFWGPLLRAATLGQLGNKADAEEQISDLKKLKPDFESKAQNLIGRYVKEKKLADKIVEGLQKAGLKIKP